MRIFKISTIRNLAKILEQHCRYVLNVTLNNGWQNRFCLWDSVSTPVILYYTDFSNDTPPPKYRIFNCPTFIHYCQFFENYYCYSASYAEVQRTFIFERFYSSWEIKKKQEISFLEIEEQERGKLIRSLYKIQLDDI